MAIPVPATAAAPCLAYQVVADSHRDPSTLFRVDLNSGRPTRIGELKHTVNAMGYAQSQDLVYGLAPFYHRRLFDDGAHLITIDSSGGLRDLGPVQPREYGGHGRHHLIEAHSGAVRGSRLHVLEHATLSSIDIDPGSPSFRTVVRKLRLHPAHLVESVADWDVSPADGQLYGVSTSGWGGATIVRVDPDSGAVSKVATPHGLPGDSSYGAVVVSGRTMYAANNDFWWHSRLYRIDLDHPGSATEVAKGRSVYLNDYAGCLGRPEPTRPTTTTTPPATTTPPPRPTTTPRVPDPPPGELPAPVPPPPAPTTTPPPNTTPPTTTPSTEDLPAPAPATTTTTTTTPPPTTSAVARALPPRPIARPIHSDQDPARVRRWVIAVAVLTMFGGGLAAARRLR